MVPMSAKKSPQDTYWNDRATFRTDSEVRGALSSIRARLVRSGRIAFLGRKVTEEAIFAALVLWADAQPADALEGILGPVVARIEAMIGEKGDPGRARKSVQVRESRTTRKSKPGNPGRDPSAGPAVPARTAKGNR